MLKNYFKITFRNLIKNKTHSLINILGLSLGITCALIIFLIVSFERSFDNYHDGGENIYRIVKEDTQYGESSFDPGVQTPLPEAVRTDFPEIEHVTIVDANFGDPVFSVVRGDGEIDRFKEKNAVAFVNPDYFRIFKYDWLLGDSETALNTPNSIVISESIAQKYFPSPGLANGYENPLGKRLTYNNRLEFQVTGLVKDPPENANVPMKILLAWSEKERGGDNWGSTSTRVQCYLKLPANMPPEQIESRFEAFLTKHHNEQAAKHTTLTLQPLTEMHYDVRFDTFGPRTISERTLLALALIGVFLLVTACINFINLNTAAAVSRSKEVGVRKVLGSTRRQLTFHFLGETAVITFLAIGISVAAAEMILPRLTTFLGYELSTNLFNNPQLLIFLAILFAATSLVAGFYPAIHLSGFSPIQAIRNKMTGNYGEGLKLRKGLVVLQFAISQVLIISTVVISSQMAHFGSVDMGFNQEAVVEFDLPLRDADKLQRLKTLLLQNPAIKNAAFSNTGSASNNSWGGNYTWYTDDGKEEGHAHIKFVDQDFLQTYQVKLLAGEDFVQSDTLDRFLVNEAFAKEVGYGERYAEILGNRTKIWGREAAISGVVHDFHVTSLHHDVFPVIMVVENRYWLTGVKIDMQNVDGAIAAIENAWAAVFPEFVLEYQFLDESIEQFYETEKQMATMINTFTIVAVLIGCLGLFGLVSYMAARRTKEIGVRKVLGATFSNIVTLLSKEFAALLTLAFLVAAPVAWYFMQAWLADFAYRIDLGAGLFFLALVASGFIAFLTVGYKSMRTASANPVESLRNE